jgi:hypothetical protein
MFSSWNSPIRSAPILNASGFAALALLFASPVAAADVAKPQEIAATIKDAKPYGSGSLGWFVLTAYDAALWTDARQWSWQAPFALTLKYHMGFSTSEIVNRSLDEEKHDNPSLTDATLANYRATMNGLFPDVKSGDEITGLFSPDGTVQFFHNGKRTGQVHDLAFAQAFFGIWLSENTNAPKLREQLLHLK